MNLKFMYEMIANEFGVSVEAVEREIKEAIADTAEGGEVPTVEEYIERALLEEEREEAMKKKRGRRKEEEG